MLFVFISLIYHLNGSGNVLNYSNGRFMFFNETLLFICLSKPIEEDDALDTYKFDNEAHQNANNQEPTDFSVESTVTKRLDIVSVLSFEEYTDEAK